MADCGLPQLLIGQAIIPVIGCIRIGVIERPELVIGKCLIRIQTVYGAKLRKFSFCTTAGVSNRGRSASLARVSLYYSDYNLQKEDNQISLHIHMNLHNN